MTKILSWLLKKCFGNKFILRDEIGQALLEAKQNESKRLRKIYQENQDQIIDQENLKHQVEVEELKATIAIMEQEMNEMRLKVRNAQKVYYKSVERAKINDDVTREIGKDAEKLCHMISGMTGLISGIRDRASEHVAKIKAEEKKDLQNLSIV